MSEMIFRPLIEDMTWSYSRIKCFQNCPYRFYLKYIHGLNESIPDFYTSYGSFIHKILEEFYKGSITKDDMLMKFLFDFQTEVVGDRPSEAIVNKYITAGINYFKNFTPLPYNVVAVEKKVSFQINHKRFVGFIDYLGEMDGEYYIVDHKSKDLKQRSRRQNPTIKDQELDEMLKQLYLYAFAVKQEYGKYPKYLCFNCFKAGVFIQEPFRQDVCEQVIEWFLQSIETIARTDEFSPCVDFFLCNHLCGLRNECCYFESR